MYKTIKFFRDKEKSFIAWVGQLLRPLNISEADYIYQEIEEITESKLLLLNIFSLLYGKRTRCICTSSF